MDASATTYLGLSQQLLKVDYENIDDLEAQEVVDQLIETINYHDKVYYFDNRPIISDFQYDKLFSGLRILEKRFPSLLQVDSPTQRISEGLNPDFQTVQHLAPMMSLENTYNDADLIDFDRKVHDGLHSEAKVVYCVEPKFDGSSVALVYENDNFVRAATRGNGTEGDDITPNARTIRKLPLKVPFSEMGIYKIEIRGEVVIELNNFKMLNEEREKLNDELRRQGKKEVEIFKHSRNTAAGGLRMKDPKQVAARKLELFVYGVSYVEDVKGNDITYKVFPSHFNTLEKLVELGFPSSTWEKARFDNITGVIKYCKEWEEKRDTYPYEVDGMVIKVDDTRMQNALGKTSHHPKWAVAFKFKARQGNSKLRRVEFQVGRTGQITPVAKIDPIILTGVEITSISLHNQDFILEKDIRIGDTVIVERAGDVIPYIVGIVHQARKGDEQPVVFPVTCPSCHHSIVRPEDESAWRCINPSCPAQLEERLIHFTSKGAMDIFGLGPEILLRFLREGIINDMTDIYSLDFEKIAKLEGWKQKSIDNLKNSIEASRSNPVWRLIVALGIRHVGVTTAKMLAKQVDRLTDFQSWTQEQFMSLEDVGPKVAESLYQFFHDEANIVLINELASLGVNIVQGKEELASNVLSGKTFLFTGTMTRLSRDEAKNLVEANGGKNLSGVSENLNYLVAGEKAGSKLSKAQKIPGIQIIDEDTFLQMINGQTGV